MQTVLRHCITLIFAFWLMEPWVARGEDLTLASRWRIKLDRANRGEDQGWAQPAFWHNDPEPQSVYLPGTIQSQGYGDPSPDRPASNRVYAGPAWFERTVDIPDTWTDQRILLTLQHPHGQTTLFIDGQKIGARESLDTPHVYDVTRAMTPGRHTIVIRSDNTLKIPKAPAAAMAAGQPQDNWNGILGELKLTCTDSLFIYDVQIAGHPASQPKTPHIQSLHA